MTLTKIMSQRYWLSFSSCQHYGYCYSVHETSHDKPTFRKHNISAFLPSIFDINLIILVAINNV